MSRAARADSLARIAQDIARCEACPRLVAHCRASARTKPRAFAGEEYWGRPVPGFGAEEPSILVVGLAPAANGANKYNLDQLSPVHDQMIRMIKLAFEMEMVEKPSFLRALAIALASLTAAFSGRAC